jgi:tetratricopeptide (TPR) repeat protein
MGDNPLLEKYIARLLELQQHSSDQLSQEELQQIAREIGLTSQDLEEADKLSKDSLLRSQTYLKVGKWEEAQKELQVASDLRPLDADTQAQFAHFYFEKWKKLGKNADLQALEIYVKKSLLINAKHPQARQILEEVQITKHRKRRSRIFKTVLWLTIIPILAIAGFIFWNINPPPTGFEGRIYQVPVDFVPSAEAEGLEIVANNCEITHSPFTTSNSIEYQLLGKLTSKNFEIEALRLKAEFLDTRQEVVATDDYVWVLNAQNAMSLHQDQFRVHPTDRLSLTLGNGIGSIYFKNSNPIEIKKMRLVVDMIQRYMPPATYPEYPILLLSWVSIAPDYLSLEAKERFNYVATEQNDSTNIHILNIEITHKGSKPCRELVVQLDWLDEAKNVISSKEISLISLKHEPFLPNERLIFSEKNYCRPPAFSFPKAFASYQLKIKSAN